MNIEKLAEQYACHTETMTGLEIEYIFDIEDLQDFVELVRQDEREACANLCDDWAQYGAPIANACARSIRARGEK
jgi:hypothetical protein